jgi:hypothetical protein
MTVNDLITEGRRIQRRTILLTPEGSGRPAAYWYGRRARQAAESSEHCWISVNAGFIPSFERQGWLSIFTDVGSCEGGRLDISPSPKKDDGILLYAKEIAVLPPIDAVFSYGSPAVEAWLNENRWHQDWPYNSNFRDRLVVEKYEDIERQEDP